MNNPKVERFDRNEAGRDFVTGDVRGCFRTLEQLLEEAGFNREHDRLFSVGGLVKGRSSASEALEWLGDGRITKAVFGLAERHLLTDLEDGRHQEFDGWLGELPMEEVPRRETVLKAMPTGIEVKTSQGLVGIVHAGVRFRSWSDTMAEPSRHHYRMDVALTGGGPGNWKGIPGRKVEGVDLLVTGHEPVSPHKLGADTYWWNIDTGAGREHWNHLTILQINPTRARPTTARVSD